MADINQRIKNIKDYFIGMKVENVEGETYIYVNVKFPPKWVIDKKEILDSFGVTVGIDNGEHYFITDMSSGFDIIFDAIDSIVSKMKVIEERNRLFKEKIEALRELFENKEISLESLKTLEFKYKQPKKKVQSSKKEEENNKEVEASEENV